MGEFFPSVQWQCTNEGKLHVVISTHFPIKIDATLDASLPGFWPLASMRYHNRPCVSTARAALSITDGRIESALKLSHECVNRWRAPVASLDKIPASTVCSGTICHACSSAWPAMANEEPRSQSNGWCACVAGVCTSGTERQPTTHSTGL